MCESATESIKHLSAIQVGWTREWAECRALTWSCHNSSATVTASALDPRRQAP